MHVQSVSTNEAIESDMRTIRLTLLHGRHRGGHLERIPGLQSSSQIASQAPRSSGSSPMPNAEARKSSGSQSRDRRAAVIAASAAEAPRRHLLSSSLSMGPPDCS